MVELILTETFSAAAAQAFVSDPANWHKFFPGFLRFA